MVLFNGLTPAPTEFGSVSAAAAPAASSESPQGTVPARTSAPGSVAAVAAPASTVPPAPATASAATDSSPAVSPAVTDVPAASPSETPATTEPSPAAPTPAPAASTPVATTPAGPRAAVAQSISIPSLGVTAPVLPVGSTDGVVDPPEDPAQVGFYTGSVLPGSPAGSTVLVGHVNYANVPGALIGLTKVNEGDTVQVATLGGRTVEYRITAREVFEKAEGLPADLFVTHGPARLVLITCGGPFDTVAQRYEDNVVVVATPVV
nr:class F sortase [Nakamurella flavida]